ncbi:peptide-methionine (R)-S-oxide reductase MsrB [Natronorubrum texcoconense]|uniref:Peptide methionine sulfoxide reductase MsrB n=1 Tax=Natronorubrum texcoconense TaxID=1095776 RepID=A0A1G8TVD6_9EURY|nr:peptide-methionine (R)-S-oxide reductase MsrB [Natronorubrum texcoconense]SDJ45453.1 peptide-methionine (R)-S-oxide reductase [Natronorubrum texcoconense]
MEHDTDEQSRDHQSDTDLPSSDAEWREKLSEEQYRILREAGTEAPFSGEYVDHKDDGSYACAGCGTELFDSETKFESGCGWPSFYDADDDIVETRPDNSHGMQRTEVLCANCGGHLGHVFEDGPEPTGKRYCINSAALEFDDE